MRMRGLMAALVVGGLAFGALGQGGKPVAVSPPEVQPARAQEPPFTLSVGFPGGTVGQYIEALKASAGTHAVNVVASRSAMEVEIAPVTLRDVSLYAALTAIQGAAGREMHWEVRPLAAMGGSVPEAYSIEMYWNTTGVANGRPVSSGPETGIQVFSIRDLTEPVPGDPAGVKLTVGPEVVLTAIQAALEMSGDKGEAAQLKFHQESGLLIIHGTNEQIGAARQVLGQMQDDLQSRRKAAKAAASAGPGVDEIQTEIAKTQVKMSSAAQDLERSEAAYARAEKLAEAGQLAAGELEAVQAKRDEAHARIEMMRIDAERLQRMLKEAAGVGRISEAEAQARRAKEASSGAKSVQVYDLPRMDGKARERLIGSIKALEAAINNPERMRVRTDETDGNKLVVEADGAMQGLVRGMIEEVVGGRGGADKSGDPGAKPGQR